MPRAPLLLLALLLSSASPRVHAEDRPPAPRPNFVFIYVDDLGYGDIGPFGATKQKTPALDRFAREGTRFTDFYAAPVCSISRAQLMTGCYGARISVPGVFPANSAHGLHPDEKTIAEYLKPLGYATQIIGKWHCGDQPPFLPTRQGFDHYLGVPYSVDMQRPAQDRGGLNVVPLLEDEKVIDLLHDEEMRSLTERYTDRALAFIRENQDRPFFLYFPHSAVHTPVWPGTNFVGTSSNGRFGDWVQEVDWSTGRILDTLDALGLATNTLVIFSSDNGPWALKGADGGSAGPLRGAKGSTWEGGVRVPTLARWPGTVPAGKDQPAVAATIDILPTLVSLAGGTLDPARAIDGRDITALLKGASRESAREAHYYFAGYTLQAVRQGPWKLAFAPQPERLSGRNDIPPDAATSEPRLYDLSADIGERRNVIAAHPDVAARLRALADAKAAELGGPNPPARRPPGIVENPQLLYAPYRRPAADVSTLKPGGTLSGDLAPRVADTPFTLALTASTAQPAAVLAAHGGASAGYALYLKDGRLTFAVRTGRDTLTEISAPASLEKPALIEAALRRGGRLSLSLDGREIASGKAPSLIPHQPAEDFCLGHDNARPVADYGPAAPFKGTRTDFSVN
jgi:arylsulfatase A-like enzyme